MILNTILGVAALWLGLAIVMELSVQLFPDLDTPEPFDWMLFIVRPPVVIAAVTIIAVSYLSGWPRA